ncbi:MAG: FKBP-type peptidyl-prolyl cis-trans isomerase [Chitinophagaceae bacterium]
MLKKILFSLMVVAAFTGCIKNKDTKNTCTYDPCSQKASTAEIDSVKKYLALNNITATEHCSGVFYQITDPGTGITPSPCKRVAVRYQGMLTNGKIFDESTTATTFNLSGLIRGWTNTIPLIKEKGSIKLFIPPSLGYGSQPIRDNTGSVIIPANSILVFTIQLDAAEE